MNDCNIDFEDFKEFMCSTNQRSEISALSASSVLGPHVPEENVNGRWNVGYRHEARKFGVTIE